MGDAQSAPREAKSDAAAEEESREVTDVEVGQDNDDKVLKNVAQISDINKKAASSTAELNGHCEDEIAIEAAICPEIEVSKPTEDEETPLENEDINLKKETEETEAEQVGCNDLIEIDAKENDINESFRKFFSNIGLKLTVKRGSTDQGPVPTDVSEEEPSKQEDVKVEETPKEITEEAQDNTGLNTAEEAVENDSIVCQTLTDVTPDDFQKKEEEKTVETKEEMTANDAGTSSPLTEDATPQEEPRPASPVGPDETASPFKKFFTTGIFYGLRKKKKLEDDEVEEKELLEEDEKATKAAADHRHEEDVTQGADEAKTEKTEEEQVITKSATAPSIVINEITNSQEIVQESPLKRLLSGSSFKKLSKKQKSRKSSDAKLSDSGEHVSDQLLSSVESAENRKVETPAEAVSGEDGAWFSFKKLVTPQKKKKSSVDHEEGPIPGSKDEAKSGEGEQISDHSTEEGKRRKDSSVSWEAVLCVSGRRRSRKTSDSEEETPLNSEGSKRRTSNEMQEVVSSSPKQTGSPPEEDEGSTWRSFKKLVTPKRKVKEEEESTSEVGQDDSAFSIKRLLSGRKTRKSVDVSAEDVSKEVNICEEDSETPAVVPLSEFDLSETQTEEEKECNTAKDADSEPQMDITEIKEEVQSMDTVPSKAKDIPKDEGALESEASSAAATDEQPGELTESSNDQQLSDIPEEGVLTETTPASEEAPKDETIADDLLEITSEAITAPDQADFTLPDETEMVSAVSQLSESSKTSGNTTPIPAEYDVMTTESVLHQVAKTISISPKAVPVSLEELNPERVVCSVSHQTLESSVLEQPKVLEIHRGSEATCIETGLNAEGIDAVNEVSATAQAESIAHHSEAASTEMASEVPKEELNTAESAADEVCEINVSELKKDIQDLQITAERQDEAEGAGDVDEAASTESLCKGGEAAAEEVIAAQAENDKRKTDYEEQKLAVRSVDETGEAEVDKVVTDQDRETKQNALDHAQHEDLAAVDDLEELSKVETAEVANGECDIQSQEEKSPENIQLTETPSKDLTEESEEPKVDEAKTDQSSEAKEAVKGPAMELVEDLVQTLNTNVSVPENISTVEIDAAVPKSVESHTEVAEEAEKKESQNYQSEVAVVLESIQAPTLETEDDAAQSLKKEVSVSDDSAAETDAEESKQVESLIAATKEVERKEPQATAEQIDGSEVTVLESVQASTTESVDDAVQSLPKDVSSLPDSSPAEIHIEETKPLEPLTEVGNQQEDREPETDEVQTHQSEVKEGFESVQVATLESQKDAVFSLNNEVSLLDISPVKTGESEQVKAITEVSDEQEDKDTKADAAQNETTKESESVETPTAMSEQDVVKSLNKDTETDLQDQKQQETDEREDQEPKTDAAQIGEELTCEQTPTFNSEEDAVQSLNQAVLFSENIASTVTNTEEPKLVKSLSGVHEEQYDKERQTTITLKSSEVTQVPEVKQVPDVVQEATFEYEESRVEVLEKDIKPYKIVPKAETAEEKPEDELECSTQGIIQGEDAPETDHAQELEAAAAPSLDPIAINSEAYDVEVIFNSSAEETVTDKIISTESKEPSSMEPEGSPSNTQNIASELETCQPTTSPRYEESKAQELQTMLQNVSQPEDTDNSPEDPDRKAVWQLDQQTDSKPCDAKVEHEKNVLEDVEGLQAMTALHISSINEDTRSVEVLEKTTCLKETQPVCLNLADVSEESKTEVNLCEQQETVEGEKVGLLSDAEIKMAATNNTVISQEVISNLQDILTEKPSVVVQEALIGEMVNETEFIDKVETATLLVPDDINQIAEPSIAVVSVHMPPVEIEVNHKVQVHLMDVDIRSAKNTVDTEIQVVVTEDKEVIDVCQERIQKVENLSATIGTEEETTTEEIQVTVQDVQYVTSNLAAIPSTLPTQNIEQDIKWSETMIEVCETEQMESAGTEDEKVTNDGTETVDARQDEIPAEQEGLEESKIPSIIPHSSEVSIEDHKEGVEEVKAVEREVCIAARDVAEVAGKGTSDSTMEPLQSTQRQITTPGDAGLAVPQHTGVISSVGTMESPSSLSLEFKLNIQFAQAKAPTWPSTAPTERTEPVKPVDVSDAGVQAKESAESVHQGDECKNQTELNEVAVQATSNTEPDAGSHLIKRALITSQPVLQEVGIQAVETTEPVEQIESTERAVPEVQAVDVSQTARQQKRALLLSKPPLCEVKKARAFRQSEEENDQDVWLDAEEDIYPQKETQTSKDKVDEHVKPESESEKKDEKKPKLEFEVECRLETEDIESQRDMLKKETCEIESEGEDFAVAFEDLETSVSTVE